MNKKSVLARELADQFGVSTRTIYRDIDTLSLSGIPVYTEKGKGGGISLLPDFVLNKSILSEQEQNEILAALHGLSHVKANETNQVLNKLSTIFNKTAANWLEVDFSDWGYTNDYFNSFKSAILEQKIVEFNYYNSSGEESFKRIEPIQLWFKSGAWYLKGFCLTKQDIRLYKLTRMRNPVVTNEHFTKRDLLSIPDNSAENQPQKRKDITIKLRIASEMTYRIFDEFEENMVDIQPDGNFIATVTYPEDNWVYSFILSFGEYIEVLEPEHLRKTIQNKGQKISKNHL